MDFSGIVLHVVMRVHMVCPVAVFFSSTPLCLLLMLELRILPVFEWVYVMAKIFIGRGITTDVS
jgi:hypothetical protein